MSKPREFVLALNCIKDYETIYPKDFDAGDSYDLTKVIEYSAYEELQKNLAIAVEALTSIAGMCLPNHCEPEAVAQEALWKIRRNND